MTPTSFGIDTSVLVRLACGLPEREFKRLVQVLGDKVAFGECELWASNMVIGEAYVALCHHYDVSKADARAALHQALSSGLVQPVGGDKVLTVLSTFNKGSGLLDRLIALDYATVTASSPMQTLTLDRKMAALDGVQRIDLT